MEIWDLKSLGNFPSSLWGILSYQIRDLCAAHSLRALRSVESISVKAFRAQRDERGKHETRRRSWHQLHHQTHLCLVIFVQEITGATGFLPL